MNQAGVVCSLYPRPRDALRQKRKINYVSRSVVRSAERRAELSSLPFLLCCQNNFTGEAEIVCLFPCPRLLHLSKHRYNPPWTKEMWGFGSNTVSRGLGLQNNTTNNNKTPRTSNPASSGDCSDDEVSSCSSHEEGLECPICWEFFNIVENVPYVLWCGHTMCKNCVLGLQWAVIKLPTVPIQLPFFISCPWCSLLCFRLIYKDNLTFPRKNYFLLWMVEGMNGDRATKTRPSASSSRSIEHQSGGNMYPNLSRRGQMGPPTHGNTSPSLGVDDRRLVWNFFSVERVQTSLRKSLAFLVHLTAKFPLIFIFLLIVLYAIPASAAVLALYMLVTVLFALPSFLILYFAYPSLDWLLREIFG